MKAFSALYRELDSSTSSLAKQAALQSYFRIAPPADAAWAVFFLAGGKPRQMVPNRLLKALVQEVAALPEWLFVESYEAVGDLAETIALLLPEPVDMRELSLAEWLFAHLLPLRGLPEEQLRARLLAQWNTIATADRLVYFKLITGSLRVGVSRHQVTQALAAVSGVDAKRMAQRLMGYTQTGSQPAAAGFLALIRPEDDPEQSLQLTGHPYPFFLAHPLNQPSAHFDELLGSPADWLVEWKWDGIRAQLVKRGGQSWIWSRGEELVSEQFPELAQAGLSLPDGTVLDGEIVVWRDGKVQPFNELQKRLGRKTLGSRILREQPVVLLAYDLLEEEGEDLRRKPQYVRRERLEALLAKHALERLQLPLRLSPAIHGSTWQELAILREAARSQGTEGFMLKQRNAEYGVGRTKDVGRWWKW
ncbi:MAG: cisplatin damage response ATP-dependent DNA ligase, partial [Nitrosospira sp.]